jgi:hypothetical protein
MFDIKVKVVFVLYKDHSSFSDWLAPNEIKAVKPTLCYSVGILLFEDEEQIVLARTINDDAQGNKALGVQSILKSDVLKRYCVNVKELERRR